MKHLSPYFRGIAVLGCLLFLLVVLSQTTGCATPYVEGGLYHTVTDLDTHNPAFIGGVGVEWEQANTREQCSWVHYSHPSENYPFNDRSEPHLDTFGCSVRYLFR